MTFTEIERTYLSGQHLGRLATIGPAGSPQNHPVTFFLNEAEGTIDIGGPDLGASRKFRNVQADPRVSFVVDDLAAQAVDADGHRGRGVEIRGRVEIEYVDRPLLEGFSRDVLRIRPRRIISWNLDGPGGGARTV